MSEDLISRKDVLQELDGCDYELKDWQKWKLKMMVRDIPSAQPEIIMCKDCKHWDGVDACDVIDAPVWDDDFCSMAERRSDE